VIASIAVTDLISYSKRAAANAAHARISLCPKEGRLEAPNPVLHMMAVQVP
jgi:hypothetical protein